MKVIYFISDFFADEINGGAEKCNEALIEKLSEDFQISKIKSSELTTEKIENFNGFFIIANFFQLSEECKSVLIEKKEYVIYEHDHKYISTNNPIKFRNFLAPQSYIINKDFFRSAKYVMCQSKKHAETVYKNLLIDNIVNLGVNFWKDSDLDLLSAKMKNQKEVKYSAMYTQNPNKGLNKAVAYAKQNNLDLDMIPNLPYENFIEHLSKVDNFVFFPQWLESYSRVAVEARVLNCKIITNNLLGVAQEGYFKLKGADLLSTIKKEMKKALSVVKSIINEEKVQRNFNRQPIPKITISSTFYEGDEFIKGFLDDITSQTIFDKCELIILNANSPGKEESIILDYCEKYKNIIYKKLDYRATTTEAINMVIDELATGEFITIGNIDDRRRKDCLEVQAKHLMFNQDVDLVYSDSFQTEVGNETYESNSANGNLYEHSKLQFSPENMIKCQPGPLPMWRIAIHRDLGLFDKEYEFANDWDMWLRMVDAGKKFLKINDVLGLYYFNPKGRSTSPESFKEKIKEESKLFFKYEHIFGERNCNLYRQHFLQGVEQSEE